MSNITRAWKGILDAVFPIFCLGGCGAEGEWVCANCRSMLVPNLFTLCPGCAKSSDGGRTHEQCFARTKLAAVISPYPYAQPLVREIIKHYKYHHIDSLEPLIQGLASSSAQKFQTLFPTKPRIVPLPLHRSRLRQRGFNQAERIAQAVARALNGESDERKCKQISIRGSA